MPAHPPAPPARASDARTQRVAGLAMAAGVLIFAAVAVGLTLSRAEAPAPPSPLAWALCGAAVVVLAAGWAIPAEGPGRRLVALALREAAGLIGALITLLTGSATWAVALGLLSVASILAGVATAPDDPRRPGSPRLG